MGKIRHNNKGKRVGGKRAKTANDYFNEPTTYVIKKE